MLIVHIHSSSQYWFLLYFSLFLFQSLLSFTIIFFFWFNFHFYWDVISTMQLDRYLMHLYNFHRHLMNLDHLDRYFNNTFYFLFILSYFDIMNLLSKISSYSLAILRSLEEIYLNKSILSLTLRNYLDWNFIYYWLLADISPSSWLWSNGASLVTC